MSLPRGRTKKSKDFCESHARPRLQQRELLNLFTSKSLQPQEFEEQLTSTTPLSFDAVPNTKVSSYPHCYVALQYRPYTTLFLLRILLPSRKQIPFFLEEIKLLPGSSPTIHFSFKEVRLLPQVLCRQQPSCISRA